MPSAIARVSRVLTLLLNFYLRNYAIMNPVLIHCGSVIDLSMSRQLFITLHCTLLWLSSLP